METPRILTPAEAAALCDRGEWVAARDPQRAHWRELARRNRDGRAECCRLHDPAPRAVLPAGDPYGAAFFRTAVCDGATLFHLPDAETAPWPPAALLGIDPAAPDGDRTAAVIAVAVPSRRAPAASYRGCAAWLLAAAGRVVPPNTPEAYRLLHIAATGRAAGIPAPAEGPGPAWDSALALLDAAAWLDAEAAGAAPNDLRALGARDQLLALAVAAARRAG